MHKVINQIKQQIKQLLFKFCEVTKLTSQQKSPGVIQHFSHIFSHNSSLDSIIKNAHNLRVVGTLASAGLITVMTLTVHPIINKTQSAEAAPGVANQSESSITMTSGYSSAELNLSPNANGVFSYSSDDELAKFGITTNNYTGYTLSIKGSDNTQQLTNSTTSTSLDSITSVIDSSTFDTNTYNGKWGYVPSKYNSVDNASFRPAPTTTASTLDVTTTPNTKKNNAASDQVNCDNYNCNEYTIGLGARADMSTPAGTYTNTFILTAVGNPIVYTINYSKGDITDTVSNLPSSQSGSVSTTSVALSSTIPTRANYTFLYWCLGVLGNNSTTCDGTTYNAGASFGIDQTTDNTTTLYAVWSPNITIKTATGISKVTLNGTETSSTSGTTVTGLVYGQSYTLTASNSTGYSFSSWSAGSYGSIANTTSTGASTTYTVGAGPSTITPTAIIKSNLSLKVTFAGTGVSSVKVCKTSGNCSGTNLMGTVSTSGSTVSGLTYNTVYYLYPTYTTGYGLNSWSKDSGAVGTLSSTSAANPTYTIGDGTNAVTINGKINSYTITLSRSNASAIVIDGTSRTGSSISLTYGSHTISGTYPSGYEFSSWATSNSTNLAIASASSASTSITVHGAATLTLNGKASCTAVSGYMQNFTGTATNYCSDSGTLTDNRDNQNYMVAKLADGKWWMLDNLRLGSTSAISLTTSNTNIASNWTLPAYIPGGYDNSYDTAHIDAASKDTTVTSYGSGSGKVGVYYNYCAASAGTYCYAKGSGTSDASYDICPKGWRMPTGGSGGEYQVLYQAYSSNVTNFRNALSTPLSGYFYGGSTLGQGSSGYFWSSTYYGDGGGSMRYLGVGSSSVNPTDYGGRYFRYSVRCVLK